MEEKPSGCRGGMPAIFGWGLGEKYKSFSLYQLEAG